MLFGRLIDAVVYVGKAESGLDVGIDQDDWLSVLLSLTQNPRADGVP